MLQEVAYHQSARTVTHGGGASFGNCGSKDTPLIFHCRQLKNAITASKVVGHDPGPVADSDARMSKCRGLCGLDGREELISSTKGAHHNVGAAAQVEGRTKVVDLSAMEARVLDLMRRGKTTKEIAAKLCIPEHTVALHVRHSLKCLRARNVEELLSLIREYH